MNNSEIKAAEEAQPCETVWVKTVEDTFGGFKVYLLSTPSCKKENDHESAREEKVNIEQIKAAVNAARERINIENRGELLPCPFCHGSAQLVKSRGLTKAECARYEYDEKCCVNPETVLATEDRDGVDGCAHIWNYRPAQEQADAALIALWEQTQEQGASDATEIF